VEPTCLRLWKPVGSNAKAIIESACLLKDSPHLTPPNWVGKNLLPKPLNIAVTERRLSKSFAMNDRIGSINRARIRLWLVGCVRRVLIAIH
jgi:hypothetical protein